MKLTMNRNGKFSCSWANTDNKCGVTPGTWSNYTYQCHIETGDVLDKNGFILDQLKIDEYFQKKYSKYPTAISCERIAINAVQDIKRMIENHMLNHSGMSVIYRIAVTIGLVDNESAMMTAEWVPETAKQIANVKKTKAPAYSKLIVKFSDEERFAELEKKIKNNTTVWDDILEYSRLKAKL